MPRRKSDIPLPVRLRNNQRRSRERRKEYIEDIKKRLSEYEKKGIEASIEVQGVARRVAEENRLLRLLLLQRGVSDQEVRQFLETQGALGVLSKSLGSDGSNDINGNAESIPVLRTEASPFARSESFGDESTNDEENAFTPIEPQSVMNLTGQTQAPQRQAKKCDENKVLQQAVTRSCSSQECGPKNQAIAFSKPASNPFDRIGLFDTACHDAAVIVASMRWHKDTDLAREELGCVPGETCRIPNTKLMELLS